MVVGKVIDLHQVCQYRDIKIFFIIRVPEFGEITKISRFGKNGISYLPSDFHRSRFDSLFAHCDHRIEAHIFSRQQASPIPVRGITVVSFTSNTRVYYTVSLQL